MTDSRTQVATNLRAIIDMADRLGDRAVDLNHDGLLGGEAMVNLAGIANLEAWEHQQQASERLGRAYTSAEDEDPEEAWSCFQTLEFWSEEWRRETGMDYDMRHTITTEAQFLANPDVLDWAWENEAGWDDFTRDVKAARRKLENVLHEGDRSERSRVVCNRCDDGRWLIRKYGRDGRADQWKCPGCKATFDDDERGRAYATQLRSSGAQRYVSLRQAVNALALVGRRETLIRKWLGWDGNDPDVTVEAFCELGTRRRMVWWPDLWRQHLMTDKGESLERITRM